MDHGFCVLEMLFDAENKPVDYRFVEYNIVFEKQTGLKDAVDKTARELVPNLEQHWFERYGNVALTGEPIRFTEGSDAMGRWFEVYAFRIGSADSRKVALLFTDISERRKGEEALRQSESNLRNIITRSPVAMCLLQGPSFVVELANDRIIEIWGKSPEEMLHKPVFESLPEAGRLGLEQEMQRVYTTGEPYIANELAVPLPRNGVLETTYLNFIYEAYRSGDGTITGIIAVATEVTDLVVARKKVEESEQDLRDMVLQAPVGICVIDAPTLVSEIVNDSFIEIAGKPRDAILGKMHWDTFVEAKPYYEAALSGVIKSGIPYHAQEVELMLIRHGREEIVYMTFVYAPMKDASGFVKKVAIWVLDNTLQVLSRKKIEESNNDFKFVTDFMPQMIWVTRPDGYHYYYNKQWYDYTGLTYGETGGEGWNYIFHPEDQERAWKVWQHSLATGEPYQIEYRCRRFDGAYRWFLGRALPLIDESGAILKWFGTCTDIDDQKRAAEIMEHKVEERTRELSLLNEKLSQFTYAASHDLQEPLRKITFFLDRLLSSIGQDLRDVNKHTVDRIEHTTGRMRSLIDDLLAYSNTTSGITSFKEVDLTGVIKEVQEDMEVTIIEKGARIDFQQLPVVKGDQRQLRQMFQNLVSNALKYHKKDETPNVQISARLVNGGDVQDYIPQEQQTVMFHQIQVRDNGIGFHPDDAERIFRLFQRLHGKAEYPGTGVGLAIVQKVVENHHGFIWAESQPGNGATFNILLPLE